MTWDKLSTPSPVISKWKGKIWEVIGDSNTEENDRATKKYHDYIAGKTGVINNNRGISGTGWFVGSGGAYFNRLTALDPNADLITVMGGGNDYAEVGKTLVLGAFGDTDPNASFYGSLDKTLTSLITKYPTKTIAVLTQTRRNNSEQPNASGITVAQLVQATIEVCNRYSIPYIDLYHSANVYPWDANYITQCMPDGVHLNDLGQQKLADKISTFLETL